MTDNEKRAHDLAVAMVQITYDMAKISNDSKVIFDAYVEYLKAYNMILDGLNRDFPEWKDVN